MDKKNNLESVKYKIILTKASVHIVVAEDGKNYRITEWHDENGKKYFCWDINEPYDHKWVLNQVLPSFRSDNEASPSGKPLRFENIKEVVDWICKQD